MRTVRHATASRAARLTAGALACIVLALPLAAQTEHVDYAALYMIKEEGFERSTVMETLSYLTDVHGPRLTGSPNLRAAADWAAGRLKAWGLANVALEPWGEFGRGWSNERTYVHAVAPTPFPLIAYARAWTPGTTGTVTADAVHAPIEKEEDFARYAGTLKGRIALIAPAAQVDALFAAPGTRYTETELEELTAAEDPTGRRARRYDRASREAYTRKRNAFLLKEGVLAVMEPGRGRGDSGSVLVGSGGSRNPKDPPVPVQLVVASEHYNRVVRMLEKKVPVRLEINVQNRFHDADPTMFNVVAEIPGGDKRDEVVMLGAHFDSWHAGTGATDNAAGSAVMMEAARILVATGLRMRRTIRLALWTGEEQGLLGSRAYVKNHFADRETMTLKPAHATLAAYFNLDNGTGAIRGVYLQGNDAVAPIFSAWMHPLRSLGMSTLTVRDTRGTDHLSFDAVGLPGFQFVQDPIEYDSRSHHSNMDLYERIQPADMMKNAVIIAAFVYHAANREDLLPRKPLPPPERAATSTTNGGR
jgi:hypothetical protein